jgi:hypothetical protein
MPSYTIALAHDTSFHGFVGVEGDTWEEAVASLTSDDWSECFEEGRGGWEQQQRVVHRGRGHRLQLPNDPLSERHSAAAGDTDRG